MARMRKMDSANDPKHFKKSTVKGKARKPKVFFLIVCEGEKTEPNYFKNFKREFEDVILEIECEGRGYNTQRVVEEAIRIKNKNPNKYDRVWTVFDKDCFPAKDFNSAIQTAKLNNIGCAWSNEAFELWYLLHFQYRHTSMSREDYKKAIEKEINKTWKKSKSFRYAKNSAEIYDVLQKYGNQKQAIKRAEKLSKQRGNCKRFATHNPRTQVHELVKQLTGQDKKLMQEIKQFFK